MPLVTDSVMEKAVRAVKADDGDVQLKTPPPIVVPVPVAGDPFQSIVPQLSVAQYPVMLTSKSVTFAVSVSV